MLKLICILFTWLLFLGDLFAQSEMVGYLPRILTAHYTIQNGDVLEKILNVNISLKSDLTKKQKDKIISLIKNTNPSITNWNQLKEKKIIYIEVPFDSVNPNSFLLSKQLNPENGQVVDEDEDEDEDEEEVIASPSPKESAVGIITQENESKFKYRYSLITSSSLGTFVERRPSSGSQFRFDQFSPLTVGFAISAQNETPWSFSTSAYLAFMSSPKINYKQAIQNSSVDIPPELGITAYAQRMIVPAFFSVYTGVDFEKFSTLNLAEIEEMISNTLTTREHSVFYGTLGSNLYLKIKDHPLNLRASYSHSVLSHVNVNNLRAYKGFKAIVYLQLSLNEHFYLSSFYKFHKMSGESDLTVNRIGLGIGYLF